MSADGFTPTSYSLCGPQDGLSQGHAIWASSGSLAVPLVYLRRPKWIKNDASWQAILDAIEFKLQQGIVIR
jgi:hypothetical protein